MNDDHTHLHGMSGGYRFLIKFTVLAAVTAIVITAIVSMRAGAQQNQVSVSAEGSVFAAPNIGEITLGVRTVGAKSAADATQDGVTKMNAVIAALALAGAEDRDVKTTQYNLYPEYDYIQERGQELRGWQLDQSVRVKVRDLDKVGNVIAAATAAGANQAGNIRFTIDDEDELKEQARADAIEKARKKAARLADAAGIKLGKITNIYESSPPTSLGQLRVMDSSGFGGGIEGIPAPNIQTGENEIIVNMTLVYEIK